MTFDQQKLDWINAILANDETSTDEELLEHFVNEGGLTCTEAEHFVAQRNRCLKDMFYRAT